MLNKVKWDQRYLSMAGLVSSWSKDPSTQCGAVIVNEDNEVVSVGFNGIPKHVDDSAERLDNRKLKYQFIVHAEQNAMIFARQHLKSCTLYTWPFQACNACAARMIQEGITRHVSIHSDNPRWVKSFSLAELMLKEANVQLTLY